MATTRTRTRTAGDARWPWLTAATLLVASAVTAAVSLHLHWAPCRGSMLDGSVLQGFPQQGHSFSDACLRRMDTGLPIQGPPELGEQVAWASELGALAIVLAAVAWAVVVLGLRWSPAATLIGLLPSLGSVSVAVQSHLVARVPARTTQEGLSGWVLLLPEVLVVLALAVGLRQPGRTGPHTVRLVLLAWGSTAFGLVHQLFDYLGMGLWTAATWDLPPGTGVTTVAALVLTAIGVSVPTLRPHRREPVPLLVPEGDPAPARAAV